MPVVLCFGDSNTHGSHPARVGQVGSRFDRETRWPGAMAAELGPDWYVIEEGLGGRTTVHDDPEVGVHKNGETALLPILESHKPIDLIIIMLGTNDLKKRFDVPGHDIAKSVGKLAGIALNSGHAAKALLVCPPLVVERGPMAEMFTGAEQRGASLPARLAQMAADIGTGYLDASTMICVDPVDGVHFDAAAHKLLGQTIATRVQAMMNEENGQ
jgi:lysophospholipase L1-like esterase